MHTPWLDIPLADYEGHMALPSVGQDAMLATLFGELLAELSPPSVAVIGCAGGNGFEQVRSTVTTRLVGVDINPHYIDALRRRHAGTMAHLELHVADVEQPLPFEPVDLIYAALVFEYVALAPTLRHLAEVCRPGGVLATVLQLPSSAVAAVSPSPFASLRTLAPSMRLVPPSELLDAASGFGFVPLSSRRMALPSGKEFVVQVLRRVPLTPGPNSGPADGGPSATPP